MLFLSMRVTSKIRLTSAVLPKRHGPVFLRQIRRLEAVLVLEPGHQLVAVADGAPQRGDDERRGQQQQADRHDGARTGSRRWTGLGTTHGRTIKTSFGKRRERTC